MARRLIDRPFKARIAETAIAAFGEGDALADIGHIGQKGFIIFSKNLCADRNGENFVIAIAPERLRPMP